MTVLIRRDTRDVFPLHEDTVRRQPSASQEDSLHQEPNWPDLDLGLPASRTVTKLILLV